MNVRLNDILDTSIPVGIPTVRVGAQSISASVTSLTLGTHDEKYPIAEVTLSAPVPPFDYFAELTVVDGEGKFARPRFSGTITHADRIGNGLRLRASGMTEFTEYIAAPWVTRNVDPMDLIYMLARTSGLNDERINIEVAEKPILEVFEIVVPVRGCRVERAIDLIDGVRLVPPSLMRLGDFSDETTLKQLAESFESAGALAVVHVFNVRRLYRAEEIGIEAVRAAVAWMTLRLRVGASRLGDGEPRAFVRADSRSEIALANVVCATGLLTGRRWVRDRGAPLASSVFDVRDLQSLPGHGVIPRGRVRLAAAALARAADESRDSLERLNAFWESAEFYAADIQLARVFSKADKRALFKRALDGLTPQQTERLEFAIGQLNSSPLMLRMWARAEATGEWVSDGDKAVVARLREARNDIVHGRSIDTPVRSDLELGVSVLARLVIAAASSAPVE